ncbi:putative protein serine/threonine kinase [Tieghemostelium lacteum]|uniref:non-specific serine/threonine protein kinase n=1 Tax=Tieghemostelium lacteum TaxID=361077 RepID=A0A151ZJI6_TIELA|nr:putative protein serine/threonine kinase [Tieghemostelium lacteum]|eukprot:KYQ94075.1 putative protein serine/threonine kinase [Tieghemostelium lacteum]
MEIHLLKQLNHPNIAKLYNVICGQEEIYLVLELVQGCTLMDKMKKYRVVPEQTAMMWMSQISSAVSYIHNKHIIHRDIKPENLMVDCFGNIKLIDFGLGDQHNITNLHGISGTVTCGSSEMLNPRTTYDGMQNDVWSLGVLLYIMVTGEHPFDPDVSGRVGNKMNKTAYGQWLYEELIKKTVSCNFHIPEYVTPECQDLIRRCLMNRYNRISSSQIKYHSWFQSRRDQIFRVNSRCQAISSSKSPLCKFT